MKKNVKFSNKLKVKYFKKNDKPSDIQLNSISNSLVKNPFQPKKTPKKPLKFILILMLIFFFILYYFWF